MVSLKTHHAQAMACKHLPERIPKDDTPLCCFWHYSTDQTFFFLAKNLLKVLRGTSIFYNLLNN